MEILNELEKMISSIDCMIERFEKVDIEDEVDVESALNLFSTAVKHNVILKEFIAYSKDHSSYLTNAIRITRYGHIINRYCSINFRSHKVGIVTDL